MLKLWYSLIGTMHTMTFGFFGLICYFFDCLKHLKQGQIDEQHKNGTGLYLLLWSYREKKRKLCFKKKKERIKTLMLLRVQCQRTLKSRWHCWTQPIHKSSLYQWLICFVFF